MEKNTPQPNRVRLAARRARGRAVAPGQGRYRRRMGWLASAAVIAVALIVAACASSGSGSSGSTPSRAAAPASGMAASGGALKTTAINGATVLTNAKGFTVYSFAPDTPTTSRCNGSCAHFWPPVTGPATAGPGVTGTLGTIKRSDGSIQATYNGHPLYTYLADTAPGQANGNGINASGGIWHEVTEAPKPAAAAASGGAWGTAREMPGTAALNTGGDAQVASVSCASAGNCIAGGYYRHNYTTASQEAFVASEVNGTWHAAIEAPSVMAVPAMTFRVGLMQPLVPW